MSPLAFRDMTKENAIVLVCCLAASVGPSKHSVEEATRRLCFLCGFVVVEWKGMLKLRVRTGRIDMYNCGAAVCIVAVNEARFGMLFRKAHG